MKKFLFRIAYFCIVFFCVSIAAMSQATLAGAATPLTAVIPSGDTWQVSESAYFKFIFRERDRAFARDLALCENDVYHVVCGYFGFEPKEKPPVILSGDRDFPAFGGYLGPLPLRIVLSTASTYAPRTILTHEFAHWMNAMRPTGLMWGLSNIFGKDLAIVPLGFQFHFLEGVTSFIDGHRRDVRSEMYYKAPILEDRMWSFEQTWTGGDSEPGALRVYLSGLLLTDYLYRHFGADAFSRLHERFAAFPFLGDTEALRFVTGMDPQRVWSEAVREKRESFQTNARIDRGVVLTPQDTVMQQSWWLKGNTDRGLIVYRSSLSEKAELGFFRPDSATSGGSATPGLTKGSWATIHGGATGFAGLASNKAGTLLVVAVVGESFGSRDDERVVTDLWRLDVQPAQHGLGYTTVRRRLTEQAQLTSPAMNADGTQLYAVQRVAHEFRLVKVDLQSGKITVILDGSSAAKPGEPAESRFSVQQVSVSPDGKKLALLTWRQGDTDLAVCNEDGSDLRWITRDPGSEFQPRFSADGSIVFVSDRENAMVLYRYRFDTNRVERILRDAVGAMAGDIVSGPSGTSQFVYQAYTSTGFVLKALPVEGLQNETIPGFAELRPNWIATRDAVWKDFLSRSPSPNASIETVAPLGPEQPLVDSAFPTVWYPWIGSYAGHFWAGASVQASSFLGTNSWNLSLGVLPDSLQPITDAVWSFDVPGVSGSLSGSWRYGDGIGATNAFVAWQSRSASASISVDVFSQRTGDFSTASLSAGLSSTALWMLWSAQPFDFYQSLQLSPSFGWSLTPRLSFSVGTASAPLALFGSDAFFANTWANLRPLRAYLAPAAALSVHGRFGIGTSAAQLSLSGAWDSLGVASSVLSGPSSSWLLPKAPWRTEVSASWGVPLPFNTRPLGDLSIEKSGLRFSGTTGAGLDYNGNFAWDGFVVASAEYFAYPLWASLEIPLRLSVSVRLPGTDPAGLSLRDFVFSLGIYTFSTTIGPAIPSDASETLPQELFRS